jgi:S-adenosylmethionine-diacylglycerol 3-amino-3-carboxypropyl transferase
MQKLYNIAEHLQEQLFSSVVSNNLVYNTCWEDPRVDRQLLQMNDQSTVVMLTSAGCNALDYLLDDVAQIYCVDTNPAQNALLEFKKALFNNGNHQLLWDFFGSGKKQVAELIYRQKLRHLLPSEAKHFWDRKISTFIPTSSQPSFYFSGTSGKVALTIYNHIKRKGVYPLLIKLLNADNLKEQTYYFDEIEPQIWNKFSKWLVRQHATMTMLGVPATQQKMIQDRYEDGLLTFIRQSLRHVFTKLPLQDNYFWRVYTTGSYCQNCCPNYLLERHFEILHQRVNRLITHTSTLLSFLKRNPGNYTHFVLLDHQDWMADAKPELLAEEWKQILANAASEARILFRSAGISLDFLPDFVFDRVNFQPQITESLHLKDRVGTYEKTHLGIVQ